MERAARLFVLEEENRRLSARQADTPLDGLIAVSPEMLRVCRTVEKLAPTDVTTLLLGESGTGKELLVRALHRLSERRDERLVAINCAAIPENLLESELFGFEKGAFTGAVKTTPGKIEVANRGILFLDEVGDLPLPLQAKLLRFLQERVIERIGGRAGDRRRRSRRLRHAPGPRRPHPAGRFREDLYYRINEATIRVPPLRERQGDAIVLARALLQRFAVELRRPIKGLNKAAAAVVEQYPWPGNVRELENRVKRAVIMADGALLTPDDLELTHVDTVAQSFDLRDVREAAETLAIVRAMTYTDNNVSRTAELLGVTRPTLYSLLRKYGIKY